MKQIIEKINKNSLLAGVISTMVFIYFLEPILGFLGRALIFLYSSVSESLYDRVFQEIALGKPDYSYSLLQIISLSLLNILILFLVRSFRKRKIDDKVSSDSEAIDKAGKIEKPNVVILIARLSSFVMIIVLFISLILSEIKIKTIQTFEQQIKIITPYIDQKTKDLIISDFSRMTSAKDFDRIKFKIESISQENNIILPQTRNHLF